jgi:hypothetical protein
MEKIYFEAKVKKSQSPIEQTIKDLGIVFPNDSLGFCHAIYAKLSETEANSNGVILAKSVKDDVPQLKFTQCNMNHNRELGPVLGSILNAWVNPKTDEIEIIISFYKSLFPKHWELAQELIDNGELTVSFELKVDKNDIENINGKRKIKRCQFDGVGLLFKIRPAYKNAHVLQLANDIVNRVFDKSENLIYASFQDAVNKMEEISKIAEELIKEDSQVDKEAKDKLLAKFKEDVTKELGEELVKAWTEEQWEAELVKRANASEEKPAEKAEETPKVEEKVEEKPVEEAQKVENVVKENRVCKYTRDDEMGTFDVEETITTEEEVDGKQVKKEEVKRHTLYTQAKMDAVKADYESKISEKDAVVASKDKEIETLNSKVTFYKENAKQVAEVRAELGDYVAKLSDEEVLDVDKLENARLRKQLAEVAVQKVETASEVPADKTELKAADEEAKKEEVEETAEDRISNYLKTKYGKK